MFYSDNICNTKYIKYAVNTARKYITASHLVKCSHSTNLIKINMQSVAEKLFLCKKK